MANPALERMYLGKIAAGMDVCDVAGDKIGSIAHIYRFDPAAIPDDPGAEEYLEVKTGFLGFGKHLFVPMSAIQEVLTDSVFLSASKETFEDAAYEKKPAHLDTLQ